MKTVDLAGATMAQMMGVIVTLIAFLVGLSFLLSLPVMLLWNGCLVPAVTGVSEIGWLQAWGLSILIGMLFKSNTPTKND